MEILIKELLKTEDKSIECNEKFILKDIILIFSI